MEIRHQLWEGRPGNNEYQQDSEWPVSENKNVSLCSQYHLGNTDPFLEGTTQKCAL